MNPNDVQAVGVDSGSGNDVSVTTFSHTVPSSDPAVFVLNPVREAESMREILK